MQNDSAPTSPDGMTLWPVSQTPSPGFLTSSSPSLSETSPTGPAEDPDRPQIDQSPNAETRRLFQIAHLVIGRKPVEMAEACGVSERTIQRWIKTGLTWEDADVFAPRVLDMHPMTAFGEEWCQAADESVPDQEPLFD